MAEKPKRPLLSYVNPFMKADYDKKVAAWEKQQAAAKRPKPQKIDWAARVKERPPQSNYNTTTKTKVVTKTAAPAAPKKSDKGKKKKTKVVQKRKK
jgi:hypothetical protein